MHRGLLLEIVAQRLLALEAKVNLLLERLGLLARHELLRVLIRVCKLAAAFCIEVLLRADLAVRRRIVERIVVIG